MRKTLLASALLAKPGLLILDSPLDGLDAATQQRLGAVLNDVIEQTPAVLLLCRSPQEIPSGCNRLMLLDHGRVLARGESSSLLDTEQAQQVLAAPALRFQAPPLHPDPQGSGHAAPTVELRDVTVNFGDFCVFRDLNWRFDPQQHCVIAGPNGCGKSTLLDMLTGDNHKAYGQAVYLFGQRRGSGESVWDIKRRFGRVDARMQFAVPSGSEVLATVASGFYDSVGLRDRPSDRERATAMDWLRALDLATLAGDEFHTLSFGLQRLVLLARAMVKQPSILLLDEATLSLDAAHRRLLLEAVDHLVAETGCQLLFVSHTVGEIPRCINQRLQFEPGVDGSRIRVSALSEA
jgi:molybdate transport system ATP-binding protein